MQPARFSAVVAARLLASYRFAATQPVVIARNRTRRRPSWPKLPPSTASRAASTSRLSHGLGDARRLAGAAPRRGACLSRIHRHDRASESRDPSLTPSHALRPVAGAARRRHDRAARLRQQLRTRHERRTAPPLGIQTIVRPRQHPQLAARLLPSFSAATTAGPGWKRPLPLAAHRRPRARSSTRLPRPCRAAISTSPTCTRPTPRFAPGDCACCATTAATFRRTKPCSLTA